MTDRMYYSQEAEKLARRQRVLIAALAAAVGLVTGVLITMIRGSAASPDRPLGENLGQLVQQGSKQAQKVAKQFVENAVKATNNVKEQVDLAAGS